MGGHSRTTWERSRLCRLRLKPMNLVHHLLDAAQKRLAVLSREASACEAAGILANPETPLVVVCDGSGAAVGVICRSDIVKLLARGGTDVLSASAGAVMSTPILSCHVEQPLKGVWTILNK